MHYFMRQAYSPLMVSAIVVTGSSGPTPSPTASSLTCQPHVEYSLQAHASHRQSANPAACCAECGTTNGCAAYTFDGQSLCWHIMMTNVSSHRTNASKVNSPHKPPPISGVCTGNACTTAACSKCMPFGPDSPLSNRRLVVHVANDRLGGATHTHSGASAAFSASNIKLELISFADSRRVELPFTPLTLTVKANSGAVIFSQPLTDVLNRATATCPTVSDCFALASFHDRSQEEDGLNPTINTGGGLALLANFPQLSLKPANVTARVTTAAAEGVLPAGAKHGVVLSSDVATLFVMMHSGLRGRWSENGVLLLPGAPKTLGFVSWEAVSDTKAFAASLHVDVTNPRSVVSIR